MVGGRKGVCGEPFTLDDCFFPPLGPVANFLPQMLLLGTHSEPDQELWSSARNTGVISVSRSASSLSIYSIFLSLAICPWICLFGEKKCQLTLFTEPSLSSHLLLPSPSPGSFLSLLHGLRLFLCWLRWIWMWDFMESVRPRRAYLVSGCRWSVLGRATPVILCT